MIEIKYPLLVIYTSLISFFLFFQLLYQARKLTSSIVHEFLRCVKLLDAAKTQNQDPITLNDRVDAVSNGYYSGILELATQQCLDSLLSDYVDVCRSFVKYHNLGFS